MCIPKTWQWPVYCDHITSNISCLQPPNSKHPLRGHHVANGWCKCIGLQVCARAPNKKQHAWVQVHGLETSTVHRIGYWIRLDSIFSQRKPLANGYYTRHPEHSLLEDPFEPIQHQWAKKQVNFIADLMYIHTPELTRWSTLGPHIGMSIADIYVPR